jgi:hypothetical protein
LFALIAVCVPHQALLISLKATELWLAIASFPMQLQQKRTVLQHVFHLLLSSAFFFSLSLLYLLSVPQKK